MIAKVYYTENGLYASDVNDEPLDEYSGPMNVETLEKLLNNAGASVEWFVGEQGKHQRVSREYMENHLAFMRKRH